MSLKDNGLVQITSNVERAGGDDDEPTPNVGLNRRSMLKALAATAALPMLADACVVPDNAPGAATGTTAAGGGKIVPGKGPRGTPSDPVLINPKPRITWPLLLTKPEMVTLAAMGDMIIPADEKSPAASKVNATDYINEIASEPSRGNLLVQIRGGVAWINAESRTRFNKEFHELSETEKIAICDDICFVPKAKPGYVAGAMFFDRVRDLTAGGFYTTPQGWKDIGYIGNVALPEFKGPPVEVLQKLGLA
jgi:hypothetical protein